MALADPDPLSAHIRTTWDENQLTLQALVAGGTKPFIGTYKMAVVVSGVSGRSLINQSGSFDLTDDHEGTAILATSTVALRASDRLEALLTITLPDGATYTDRYVKKAIR
jgi:hypothetical protein